jgi:hypothetical protein
MRLLTLQKAQKLTLAFAFLCFGTGFFPFRHSPQKYTNNLAYNGL